MGWKHRRRRGIRGRFPKPISIGKVQILEKLIPIPASSSEPIYVESAEIEALRLVDLEGFSQEEAGHKMGVSRGTVWRLLQSARRKTAKTLSEGRPLYLVPPVDRDTQAT